MRFADRGDEQIAQDPAGLLITEEGAAQQAVATSQPHEHTREHVSTRYGSSGHYTLCSVEKRKRSEEREIFMLAHCHILDAPRDQKEYIMLDVATLDIPAQLSAPAIS